jgi:hypothetical protein
MDIVMLAMDKQHRDRLLDERFAIGSDASAEWGDGKRVHEGPDATRSFTAWPEARSQDFGREGLILEAIIQGIGRFMGSPSRTTRPLKAAPHLSDRHWPIKRSRSSKFRAAQKDVSIPRVVKTNSKPMHFQADGLTARTPIGASNYDRLIHLVVMFFVSFDVCRFFTGQEPRTAGSTPEKGLPNFRGGFRLQSQGEVR